MLFQKIMYSTHKTNKILQIQHNKVEKSQVMGGRPADTAASGHSANIKYNVE